MNANDRMEKRILEQIMNLMKYKRQATTPVIIKGVQKNITRASEAQIVKRLYYLQKQHIIKDLKRYKNRQVWVFTDKYKKENNIGAIK